MYETSAYHCPLCERRFTNELARLQHLLTTAKHESIIEAYLRVASLLADREKSIAVACQQRDAAFQERDATYALLRFLSPPEHSEAFRPRSAELGSGREAAP